MGSETGMVLQPCIDCFISNFFTEAIKIRNSLPCCNNFKQAVGLGVLQAFSTYAVKP